MADQQSPNAEAVAIYRTAAMKAFGLPDLPAVKNLTDDEGCNMSMLIVPRPPREERRWREEAMHDAVEVERPDLVGRVALSYVEARHV